MRTRRHHISPALVGLTIAAAMAGCETRSSVGWSEQVRATPSGTTLSAGDPLGEALYVSYRESHQDRERFAALFGDPSSPFQHDATATAVVPVD